MKATLEYDLNINHEKIFHGMAVNVGSYNAVINMMKEWLEEKASQDSHQDFEMALRKLKNLMDEMGI